MISRLIANIPYIEKHFLFLVGMCATIRLIVTTQHQTYYSFNPSLVKILIDVKYQ